MSDADDSLDFDAQLKGLFQQAEQVIETRAAAARSSEPPPAAPSSAASHAASHEAHPPAMPVYDVGATADSPANPYQSLPQMLRPLILGVEALTRASGENNGILARLDKAIAGAGSGADQLPGMIAEMRTILDQKSGVNQRMFDALYEELRSYKDGFLLESVYRPIIRDIVSLYDGLMEIHQQLSSALAVPDVREEDPLAIRIRTIVLNLGHDIEFVLEVLARLEVVIMPVGTGKLDKLTQRTVSLEYVDDPEQDSMVAKTVKRGFLWKERVFRAEEVVTKKCRVTLAPAAVSDEPPPAAPSQALTEG